LHVDHYKILIISPSILLVTKNALDKPCRKNQKTHFMFKSSFFRKSCRLWDNVGKYCTPRQATGQYGACALHAGYLRLQTHTKNM